MLAALGLVLIASTSEVVVGGLASIGAIFGIGYLANR